jgi:RNA polymerase sigma-70 factor (ECF subfamily)
VTQPEAGPEPGRPAANREAALRVFPGGVTRQGQRALAGEERRLAFTRCAEAELATLYRAACALTAQPADAEDLVQETLLRACRAWDGFDGSLGMAADDHAACCGKPAPATVPYLFGDAAEPWLPVAAICSHGAGPEQVVVEGSFSEAVTAALRRLPERSQILARLVDIQGLSIGQAALLAGMNEGAVRSRLHRTRAQIRAQLTISILPGAGGP